MSKNFFLFVGLNMTEKIMAFLPMKDKISFSYTCKNLNNFFWKMITRLDASNKFLFVDKDDRFILMCELLQRKAPNLKCLDLSNLQFSIDKSIDKIPESLIHLNLSGCDLKIFDCFKRIPCQLNSINLSFNNQLSHQLLSNLPSTLKILIFSGSNILQGKKKKKRKLKKIKKIKS